MKFKYFIHLPRLFPKRVKRALVIVTIPGLIFAFLAIFIAISYFVFEPVTLSIVVPDDQPHDQRLLRTARDLLQTQRGGLRLRLIGAKDGQAAGALVASGKADLAVLPSYQLYVMQLQTVLIFRKESLVILAAQNGKVQNASDLAGATVGLIETNGSQAALSRVIEFFKVPSKEGRLLPLATGDIQTAFRDRRIDALAFVGSVSSRDVSEIVAAAARGAKDLRFIAIEEAAAVAKAVPWLDKVEIDQGAFGGRPARPSEDVTTVGTSVRLVTANRLDNDTVADLARQLIGLRGGLNSALPGFGLVEAPDTDEASSLVIHPGVKAYVNGERTTLFDRYGDWLYLIAIVVSGLGSMAAATFGWYQNQRRQEAVKNILQLEKLYDDIPLAKSREALETIEDQADRVFRTALKRAAAGELGPDQIMTVEMAMRELRARLFAARPRRVRPP